MLVRQEKLTVCFNTKSVPAAGHGITVTQELGVIGWGTIISMAGDGFTCLALFPCQVWLHRKDYKCATMGEGARERGNTSVDFFKLVANTPCYPHTPDDENLSWLMWNLICSISPTQRTTSQVWGRKPKELHRSESINKPQNIPLKRETNALH